MRRLSEGRCVGVICLLSSLLVFGRLGARSRKVSKCKIEKFLVFEK